MIEENSRTNGEFYVAPVYNWAIRDGKKICEFILDENISGYEQYIKEHNQRLIDFYADRSLDELKDNLVEAQEKHSAAVLNQQRTGLNSDKIHIEDTSVRIQNLVTIIKHRESGEQS